MLSTTKHDPRAKLWETYRVPPQTTDAAIEDFLTALNCPRALTVWLLYSARDSSSHDQLTRLECLPDNYSGVQAFRDAYAATKFLSKASFLDTTFDKKKVALEKFFQFEEQCRQTNNRFRNLALDPQFNGPNVLLLNATVLKIANVLGGFHPEEFFDQANWGPGVTTKLKGSYVSAVNKFHLENGITRGLYSLVGEELFDLAYPIWSNHLSHLRGERRFDFVDGNTIVTVPKDSKTDRVIAVEPGINLWFQKACGSMIRRRLKYRASIDLNSQEWNQKCAYQGSKDSWLATADFSSASDSISLELVRMLLPPRWFMLLDSCRSKFGIRENHNPLWWEKFSSMGNGFTFELESLIFYAAAASVCEYITGSSTGVSVFGDDVVIPGVCMELFSDFSAFLGFTVNRKKSFSTGYFRESCGAHYYSAVDVKPVFLKERVRNVQAVYKLANGVRLFAHRRNSLYGCDASFRRTWLRLVRGVPKRLQLRVPRSLGDTGFVSNFDESVPPRARDGLEGHRVQSLTATALRGSLDSPAVLMARLWSTSTEAYGNTYTLRGRVKYRIKTVLVSQWYNLGPWI
jgi:hypothetical protein